MSENELGAFLRARREALSPSRAGLRSGPRRRTPGLRRAELATLAGVSVEYLTRLEQGRDRRPSVEVLDALSSALQLPFDAHLHLRILAKAAEGQSCTETEAPPQRVRPTILSLLDRLEPSAALVLNRINDVLAYTSGFRSIAEPIGLLDAETPNLARFVFLDPRARSAFAEWGRVADAQVAHLRTEALWDGVYATGLAEELAAEPTFEQRWRSAPTLPEHTGIEEWVHPEAGGFRLAFEVLRLSHADDQRLLVYEPADATSATVLKRLGTRRFDPALRLATVPAERAEFTTDLPVTQLHGPHG